MKIAITLNEGASMHDAIIDCARSIIEGYGAGSLTTEEDGEIEAWLGFWTSIPDAGEEYDLVIDIPEDMEDDNYIVAGVVRRKAKEYQS
jgi:hypothetical protein